MTLEEQNRLINVAIMLLESIQHDWKDAKQYRDLAQKLDEVSTICKLESARLYIHEPWPPDEFGGGGKRES